MLFSRRKFMCGLTATTLSVPALMRALSAEADAASGIILVVHQFDGGNDGFNTVIPIDSAGYGTYMQLRSNIAVPLTPANGQIQYDIQTGGTALNSSIALHPNMTKLATRFAAKKDVAIIQGVGIPSSDQDREGHEQAKFDWYTATTSNFNGTDVGWLGLAFDQLNITGQSLPPMIAMNGFLPLTMQGKKSSPLVMGGGDIGGFNVSSYPGQAGVTALNTNDNYATSMAASEFARSLANQTSAYIGAIGNLATMEPNTAFADYNVKINGNYSGVKSRYQQIARLILGGAPTRSYWLDQGGYDTHSSQTGSFNVVNPAAANNGQPGLLQEFSEGSTEFLDYLAAKNPAIASRVVVMTFSDFGRRAYSNSTAGTDHGTASFNFVMGAPVKGGLYGQYPSMGQRDNNGNVIVQVDFRNQISDVVSAMGADPTAIVGGSYSKLGFI